jgi:hypothetical protein
MNNFGMLLGISMSDRNFLKLNEQFWYVARDINERQKLYKMFKKFAVDLLVKFSHKE